MVNRPLPAAQDRSQERRPMEKTGKTKSPFFGPRPCLAGRTVFAQFLAKLHFFDLLEKLQIILLDYGQKRLGTANAAFKAAC